MQVHFGYYRLPFWFSDNMVTQVHHNAFLRLQDVYNYGPTPKHEDSIVVGQQDGHSYGVVMVGGHGSIYRALMQEGSNPAILTTTGMLAAYWGVLTRPWPHRKLTWLIITGEGFHCQGYENSMPLNLRHNNPGMVRDWFNTGRYRTEKVTPTILASHLTTLWPTYNFVNKG